MADDALTVELDDLPDGSVLASCEHFPFTAVGDDDQDAIERRGDAIADYLRRQVTQ